MRRGGKESGHASGGSRATAGSSVGTGPSGATTDHKRVATVNTSSASKEDSPRISEYTVRRLSVYCHILDELELDGTEVTSSAILARLSGTNPAQVRKDLSYFGNFGKRGSGYRVRELRNRIRRILGIDRRWKVVLVGAGNLGSALFSYKDFERNGFQTVAILDSDPKKIGTRWDGIEIQAMERCEEVVLESGAEVAVLVTPAQVAQDVLDQLVAAGVRGVLNFAPVKLEAPADVQVRNVNITIELEGLSFALKERASGRSDSGR